MSVPTIKSYSKNDYSTRQSRYEHVGKLPTRSLILAPSNSGKTVLITNLILDIYRNCFSRIYIFSPSIKVDDAWKPVIDYCTNVLKQEETRDEKFYFDSYEPEEFDKIIKTQHKVVQFMKERKMKHLHQIAIFIDDMLDNVRLMRHSNLDVLFLRGRHLQISTFVSIQKYKGVSSVVRLNVSDLYVFKLRNQADLDAFLEETSAILDKKQMEKIYRLAVNEPYGFLYVKLTSRDINDMFYISLSKRIKLT